MLWVGAGWRHAGRDEKAPEEIVFRVSFWAADWTPWRALAAVRASFPGLRFDLQPHYERA
jgi:hypothetical protein